MSWPALKTVWKLTDELSTVQFVVLEILARRVKPHTNTTFVMSISEIVRLAPSSDKAVKRARRELLRGPLVVFNGRERQKGTYTMAFLTEDGKPALEDIELSAKRPPDEENGTGQKAPSNGTKGPQAGGKKAPRLGVKGAPVRTSKKKEERSYRGARSARSPSSKSPDGASGCDCGPSGLHKAGCPA